MHKANRAAYLHAKISDPENESKRTMDLLCLTLLTAETKASCRVLLLLGSVPHLLGNLLVPTLHRLFARHVTKCKISRVETLVQVCTL